MIVTLFRAAPCAAKPIASLCGPFIRMGAPTAETSAAGRAINQAIHRDLLSGIADGHRVGLALADFRAADYHAGKRLIRRPAQQFPAAAVPQGDDIIGLSIAKAIVQAHKGSFLCKTTDGHSLTVTAMLPVK